MNTVFKRMKKCCNVTLIFMSLIMFSTIAKATQCSTLEFVSTKKNNEVYVAMISAHNDQAIEKTDNKYDILDGEHSYYLEEGMHTLIVEQWPAKKFRRLRKNNRISKKYLPVDKSTQILSLNVTAGRHYQLEFFKDKQEPSIRIKNDSAQLCSIDKNEVLAAKADHNFTDKLEDINLPSSLEYRLRKLMNRIAKFHNFEKIETQSNFIHARVNAYIGTSIDNEYKDNGKALKVLSVLPYSLAHKLQLMSGDKITHLGGKVIEADKRHPNQQLNDYFNELQLGEEIEIGLLRNNISKQLVGTYKPNVVPELSYQLDLSSSKHSQSIVKQLKRLPIELQFELDQLTIELSNYYRSKNHNLEYVNIARNKALDKRIGFSGNKIVFPDNVGLKVYEIEENSFAEYLGLKVNDVVMSINGEEITTDNIEQTLNSLSSLKLGEEISISIFRNEKLITLTNEYLPQVFVGFNFLVNLKSISVVKENLELIGNNNKWHEFNEKIRNTPRKYRWTNPNRNAPDRPRVSPAPRNPSSSNNGTK
ncbi:PDZ domain-containing protein [Thalassotalea castellviae]|uniref:PDZ domain-containing protein n=1 Tax=Thalassotalea castellviae TaxID=3075612 RepID=A0ABU3A1G4_9GAMM|nr:PDZ domain-containing protein [Thalassotalea sp. W431]MDT0604017.1 PDZ domain-containing protein [Thalassotalea sp. W431]